MESNIELISRLRVRYSSLFGAEPSREEDLDQIEQSLSLKLPEDFREIAKFYRGGMIGGISHHGIKVTGPGNSLLDETWRIRHSTRIPVRFIVIAEPPASLIVLDTDKGTVIWLDSTDISRLDDTPKLHNPQLWNSYTDFFSFLLDQEEDERA